LLLKNAAAFSYFSDAAVGHPSAPAIIGRNVAGFAISSRFVPQGRGRGGSDAGPSRTNCSTVGSGVGPPSFARSKDLNIVAILTSLTLAVLVFFISRRFSPIEQMLRSSGYFGTFIVGVLYDYSFTALPATVLLVLIGKSQNFVLAGTVATYGESLGI